MSSPRKSWLFSLALPVMALLPLQAADTLIEAKIGAPETWTAEGASPAAPVEKMKLGSWNVQWFPGGHPTKGTPESAAAQSQAVGEMLKEQLPDVMFLCEVRSLDALKNLGLSYPYIACTNIPRTEEEDATLPNQGLALMSRWPWREIWTLDFSGLPDTPDRPSRGILGAEFVYPAGLKWTLYGVHLKSNRGGVDASRMRRERAVEYLKKDFEARGLDPRKDYIVICGDFNTSATDPAFAADKTMAKFAELGFTDAAEGLPREKRLTIDTDGKARYPANDFDHVLISEALAQRMGGPPPWVEIIPTSGSVSDHCPLFVNILWTGGITGKP